MVAHTFSPDAQETEAGRWITLSLKLAWFI